MPTMTDHLTPHAVEMNGMLILGARQYGTTEGGKRYRQYSLVFAVMRGEYGLARKPAPLLTDPTSNMKLDKSTRVAYGLTLQHHVVRLHSGEIVNLCPNAGACTKGCVLNNGQGAYPTVQRARDAKTAFLFHSPDLFAYMVGYELAKALAKHDDTGIDFRPNVNSDIEWEKLLPDLFNGAVFGDSLWAYGYTKNQYVLATDGWLASHYRVAFSANEHCKVTDLRVKAFLKRGGSVAVVTNRQPDWRTNQQIEQWSKAATVVDASKDDSWVWEHGVIGDLAAKGKLRRYIGKTDFVHMAY